MAQDSVNEGLRARSRHSIPLRALQVASIVSVLVLVFQFVSAGQIMAGDMAAVSLHGSLAITIHVVFGLTLIAAGVHWWVSHGAIWPTALAGVAFALSFVQAYIGSDGDMTTHVPLAVVLTICIAWVSAWSFTQSARR